MLADIFVILIIMLCILIGYKKGLIKVAVRLFSFIAALIVALILYTPISNHIIENTEVVPSLKETIQSKLYSKEEQDEEKEAQSITETMQNYIDGYTDGVKENTTGYISEQLAITIVRVGTWIGLFAITKLLMLFIRIFGDAIANIPIIKQFNKARRYNIRSARRICNCICTSCSYKCSKTYAWGEQYLQRNRKFTYLQSNV